MIAAYLKSKLGINDIISTLMLNYIMAQIVQYLIYGLMEKVKHSMVFLYTDNFPANAILPLIKNSRIHWIGTYFRSYRCCSFILFYISHKIRI